MMLALIQTAPPPPTGDQIINTALILTQAVGAIAHKINDTLNAQLFNDVDNGLNYMAFLFVVLALVLVITIIWDGARIWLDAGTAEDGTFFQHLLDTGFLKKFLKASLLASLAAGSWWVIYEGNDPSAIVAGQQADFRMTGVVNEKVVVSGAKDLAGVFGMLNPIDKVDSITDTIKQDSAKLGAWAFARQAIDSAARMQAANAADAVWAETHPNGAPDAQANQNQKNENADPAQQGAQVMDWLLINLKASANMAITYGMSLVLLFLNFGLDVMIVRCLMFNAIYLLMAFRIATFILPLAFLAAYWDQWHGVLRGTLQVMIATTISLNVLADMTAIICSPDQVTAIISTAETQDKTPADMMRWARTVYSSMAAKNTKLTQDAYKNAVVGLLGDPTSGYVFDTEATFWAPIKFFMIFTLMVMLVGKIGTVISDAMAGSMSYHR